MLHMPSKCTYMFFPTISDFWRVSQMFKAFPTVKHLRKTFSSRWAWEHKKPKPWAFSTKKNYNYLPTTRFCAEMIGFSKLLKGPRVQNFPFGTCPWTTAAMEHEIWLLSLQWPRSPQVWWKLVQTGHPSTYFRQRNTSLKNPNPSLEWY